MTKIIQRVKTVIIDNLHMHTKVAGSGFHLPFDAHVDVMFPAGTYDVLHLKII